MRTFQESGRPTRVWAVTQATSSAAGAPSARARESGGRAVTARPLALPARLVGALGLVRPRGAKREKPAREAQAHPRAAARTARTAPPRWRRSASPRPTAPKVPWCSFGVMVASGSAARMALSCFHCSAVKRDGVAGAEVGLHVRVVFCQDVADLARGHLAEQREGRKGWWAPTSRMRCRMQA